MNIALYESLAEAVWRRAEAVCHAGSNEYVEAVIRADLDQTGEDVPEAYPELSTETRTAILERLDSGLGGGRRRGVLG